MAEKSRRSSSKIMRRHPGGSRSIKTKTRKSSATIVQKTKGPRGGTTRYRFPMPDKSHARSALAMLPKAPSRYNPFKNKELAKIQEKYEIWKNRKTRKDYYYK